MINVRTIRFKAVTQQTLNLRSRIRKIKTSYDTNDKSSCGERMALIWRSSTHYKNVLARKDCSVCVGISLYNHWHNTHKLRRIILQTWFTVTQIEGPQCNLKPLALPRKWYTPPPPPPPPSPPILIPPPSPPPHQIHNKLYTKTKHKAKK